MVEPPEVSSQDNDQYHGKGWRGKKARGPSQTASMLPTDDETHTADLDEQAIRSANAEPNVTEQDANSEQSSSTVYAEEAPVTSRSDCLQYHCGYWHSQHCHTDMQYLRVVGMSGRCDVETGIVGIYLHLEPYQKELKLAGSILPKHTIAACGLPYDAKLFALGCAHICCIIRLSLSAGLKLTALCIYLPCGLPALL